MEVSTEKLDDWKVALSITLPAEDLAAAEKKAVKAIAKRVNIPGFRKGKAPQNVIERQLGKEYILDEAFDMMYPKALDEALEKEDLIPVTKVELDVVTLKEGEPVVFKASFTKHPDVTLGEYKGLKIDRKDDSVSDEAVDEELKAIQHEQGKLLAPDENATAENGDMVNLDFDGFINDEAFEGGKGADYPLELGSGAFIPGFEEQLIGVKAGDEREVKVTFPEEYHAEDLAGKEAVFKCKISKVRKRELPPIDDELAKKISKFQTLEELKADIRKHLEHAAKNDADATQAQDAINAIADGMTAEIPPVMIEEELDRMMKELELRLEQHGIDVDDYFEETGIDVAQYRENNRENAVKNVRVNLALEAVAKAENLEVTQNDRIAEVVNMAFAYNVKPQEVVKVLQRLGADGQRNLNLSALRRKTTRFIFDNLAKAE